MATPRREMNTRSWLDALSAEAVNPDIGACVLSGNPAGHGDDFMIREAAPIELRAYRRLRRENFVLDQGLFVGSDIDDLDDDPRTRVLVATASDGTVLGGVRLAPATPTDIGWWTGSRLVVDHALRTHRIGKALVRAACAYAENNNVLRFDATVQARHAAMFTDLGWTPMGPSSLGGVPHVGMRWPIDRIQRLADATKSMLGPALAVLDVLPMSLGGSGFRGDDAAPVPGGDLLAACDAIVPSMVERDPEWAGWCAVLVNLNDLAAMGAEPVAMLDAVAAPTRSLLTRILRGLGKASAVWQVPVLGGHTQLGVPAALSVTALGRTDRPVTSGGGRAGDQLALTADLEGGWRTGYHGRQWDSSSQRSGEELRALGRVVAESRPRAAKDVSMAGIAGTAGMLAESSGVGVEIDLARLPKPETAAMADWLTCFPGFAMLTADRPGTPASSASSPATSAICGELTTTPGVRLRWPDGITTTAVTGSVTGLGIS